LTIPGENLRWQIFGYQFSPTAALFFRFEKMTYEALI